MTFVDRLAESSEPRPIEDRRDGRGKGGRGPAHPDWYRFQPAARDIPYRGPLADLLDSIFHSLSQKLAGGQRENVNDLLPGADDPLEGSIPEEFLPDVFQFDWFDPTVWAHARENELQGVDMGMMSPASGPGRDGNGGDWFRGGEAPNNYVNRHNPLYRARAEFAVKINSKIEELFGVNGGGVGWMRPPKSGDAAPGGRSGNSDHYSAGAVDYYGTPEQLDRLRAWLTEQPFTSFIRWRSESHGGESGTESGAHLHVSFDIGWIAQNYFEGRTLPSVSASASPQPAFVASPTLPDSPTSDLGVSGVAPEVVRGRPS